MISTHHSFPLGKLWNTVKNKQSHDLKSSKGLCRSLLQTTNRQYSCGEEALLKRSEDKQQIHIHLQTLELEAFSCGLESRNCKYCPVMLGERRSLKSSRNERSTKFVPALEDFSVSSLISNETKRAKMELTEQLNGTGFKIKPGAKLIHPTGMAKQFIPSYNIFNQTHRFNEGSTRHVSRQNKSAHLSLNIIQRHWLTEHNFTSTDSPKTNCGMDNRPYQCQICDKTFKRRSSLATHRFIHTNTKPHDCNVCKKQFLRKSDLKKHLLMHTGRKPYQCQHCGRRFSQSSNMLTHMRRHLGIRPFLCIKCGRSFFRMVDLRRHQSRHLQEIQ